MIFPVGPWAKDSTHFMDWSNKWSLLIADYFSQTSPPYSKCPATHMTAVTGFLTKLYVLNGIPLEIFMENRQPFTSMECTPS